MVGVVLCGGRSTRMGTDKGLLVRHNTTWAQLVRVRLASLNIPVVYSVNKLQFETYRTLFSPNTVIHDDHTVNVTGPLRGILSVNKQYSEQDLMVVACDMIKVSEEPLRYLLLQYAQLKAEAAVFMNEHQPEPLAGIYSSRGLKKIVDLDEKGQLENQGPIHMLKMIRTVYLPVPHEWKSQFQNFNTPADLVYLT